MTLELTPGKLWGLRRLADANGRFKMVAVDQRPPIKGPIAKARGLAQAPYADVARFKAMLVEELQSDASALLVDPHYALPQALLAMSPAKGLVVTLEDSVFRETPGGRLSAEIDDWSVEKIKRVGGDAVKVLAWYRPDASDAVRTAQKDFVARVGEACARFDIPYVFELLVYPLSTDAEAGSDYVEMREKHADHVLESVRVFADPRYGVDLFKLESPLPAAAVPETPDESSRAVFAELGALAGRPWVMLSAGAGMAEFERVLVHAFAAGASGYLAGRAIWAEPFKRFPDWDAIRAGLREVSAPYMARLNALTDARARPFLAHEAYGEGGPRVDPRDGGFRHGYGGF